MNGLNYAVKLTLNGEELNHIVKAKGINDVIDDVKELFGHDARIERIEPLVSARFKRNSPSSLMFNARLKEIIKQEGLNFNATTIHLWVQHLTDLGLLTADDLC